MKPVLIEQIEAKIGEKLNLPPVYFQDPIAGLMAIKSGYPKYLMEGERLIGLNLAQLNLSDDVWQEIITLLERRQVQLQALNLWGNNLKKLALPNGIGALKYFDISENPLEFPGKEITEQGNAAILNFFKQIEEQEGTVPLYEAKLLIVGEPGSGKTTLLKKLSHPDYIVPKGGDKEVESTVGINIHEGYSFPFCKDTDITFKANLWDFGGQDIQYMTHHFFLTPRALYVLVADDRKQNTEFDYWFRIINLLGRERDGEKIHVLVVLNEVNHKSVSNFDLAKYRESYPDMNIQQYEVDFSVKDSRSDGLAAKIQEMLCDLPHIGDPLPRLWSPIREDLMKHRVANPHIKFADFAAICSIEREGKRLNKEEDQRNLSSYLHRLGVILHYQEDDSLDNFVVLNPQWAVDAVYGVLKDKRVEKNHGKFTDQDLKELWGDFVSHERDKLLELMSKDKFEICYPTPNRDAYIAPQLLPSIQPTYDWNAQDALKFRYQYPFMPKGLISRLIVRLSDDIAEKGRLAWKEGVVLEQKKCRAQVIQKKTIKEGLEILEIEISGDLHGRKYLLEKIREEVEKIHDKSFKHIDFERMVPCNCQVCKGKAAPNFFKYSELLKYQDQQVAEIDCSEDFIKRVNVTSLIEGVFYGSKERGHWGEMIEKLDVIHQGVETTKENTTAILEGQAKQDHYLNSLLSMTEKHRQNLDKLFVKIDEETDSSTLANLNQLLDEQLGKYFEKVPSSAEIVKKWKEANAKAPMTADQKFKLKLKLPFIFGELQIAEFEKELSYDTKAVLKQIRQEFNQYRIGERTLKQLFVEED